MKRSSIYTLSFSACATALGIIGFTVVHSSADTSTLDHGNAALHCQHFPADCESGEAATDQATADVPSDAEVHASMDGAFRTPLEPGQGMFGAISEINQIIEEAEAMEGAEVDWASVDLDALWAHLQDMDSLMTYAKVEKTPLENGLKMRVSGEGRADRAVRNMIPAHTEFLRAVRPDWTISFTGEDATYEVVVTSRIPSEATKIKALGFSGFMVQDDHHASHHFGIGLGNQVH